MSGTRIDFASFARTPQRRASGLPTIAREARAACLAVVAGLAAGAAVADEAPGRPVTAPAGRNETLPLWEIGVYAIGGYTPAYPGSNQNLSNFKVLPYGIYRGSVLRLEGGGVGVRALQTPRLEWDVSAAGSFGVPTDRVRARTGMPSIGTLVEIGPVLRVNIGDLLDPQRDPTRTRFEMPLRAVFDVDDDLAHKGWSFEPRLSHTAWQGETASISVSASMLFLSRGLNDFLYGVAPAYETPERPAYVARAGLSSTRISASFRKRLTDTLQMQIFVQAATVRGAANESSPLVLREQNAGFGASLTWAIWTASERGVD